jgi:predicted porin
MKKTIVAAAVAALTAAPAFADVSISGQMNFELSSFGTATGVTDDGIAADQNADIVFKASEDLGNGLSAGVTMSYATDNATQTNNTAAVNASNNPNAEELSMYVKGDFGTVVMGNLESFTEGKLSAAMALDPVDSISIEDGRGETKRTEGAIAYVSPNFNGFHFGVAAFTGLADVTSDADGTDLFAAYSNNGLTAMASRETVKSATAGNADKDTTMYSLEYKMGDLTARVVDREVDDNGTSADSESTYFGVKYTMGANAIAVETIDEKGAGAVDANVYSVSHAMSKRTSVYLGIKDSDSAAEDQTTVGIKHTF